MSNQERTAVRPCRRCGKPCYSSASQRIGLCGSCHRFLRKVGVNPRVLGYALSQDGPVDWNLLFYDESHRFLYRRARHD